MTEEVKKEILFKPCPICGELMIPVGCCGIVCPRRHGKIYPRYRSRGGIKQPYG